MKSWRLEEPHRDAVVVYDLCPPFWSSLMMFILWLMSVLSCSGCRHLKFVWRSPQCGEACIPSEELRAMNRATEIRHWKDLGSEGTPWGEFVGEGFWYPPSRNTLNQFWALNWFISFLFTGWELLLWYLTHSIKSNCLCFSASLSSLGPDVFTENMLYGCNNFHTWFNPLYPGATDTLHSSYWNLSCFI